MRVLERKVAKILRRLVCPSVERAPNGWLTSSFHCMAPCLDVILRAWGWRREKNTRQKVVRWGSGVLERSKMERDWIYRTAATARRRRRRRQGLGISVSIEIWAA